MTKKANAGNSAPKNKRYLTKSIRDEILEEYYALEHRETLFGEPEQLFEVIEEWIGYFDAGIEKPTKVLEMLRTAEFNLLQRYFILKCLVLSLEQLPDFRRWEVAFERIKAEQIEIEFNVESKSPLPKFGFRFQEVRRYSDSLPDDSERIRYLTKVKTLFEQQDNGLQLDWNQPSFDKQCELEIKKIKELMELSIGETRSNSLSKPSSEKRAFGGTQQQNLLAAYFLLQYLSAKGTIADKARFISFLTGYSEEKIRQLFPKVLKRADDNWTEFEKDVEAVKGYFQKLGLTEIVKMIENEVSDLSGNL